MKTTLTAKLKLVTTPDQFRALRATQLAYRDALNHVSAYSFAHGKTSNSKRLQKATYADLRASLACRPRWPAMCPARWAATYKGLWTKGKKNVEARRLGWHQAALQGPGQAAPLCLAHAHLRLGRDYSLRSRAGR